MPQQDWRFGLYGQRKNVPFIMRVKKALRPYFSQLGRKYPYDIALVVASTGEKEFDEMMVEGDSAILRRLEEIIQMLDQEHTSVACQSGLEILLITCLRKECTN